MAVASNLPFTIPLYQGEDFSQELAFYEDESMTTPLAFTDPVMDIRAARSRLATFDTSGNAEGLFTIPSPGILLMTMGWQHTTQIKAGTYPLDIFAEVDGKRRAISKQGILQLVVTPRITVDQHP